MAGFMAEALRLLLNATFKSMPLWLELWPVLWRFSMPTQTRIIQVSAGTLTVHYRRRLCTVRAPADTWMIRGRSTISKISKMSNILKSLKALTSLTSLKSLIGPESSKYPLGP